MRLSVICTAFVTVLSVVSMSMSLDPVIVDLVTISLTPWVNVLVSLLV